MPDALDELRGLLGTPEVVRPHVYCCAGCGRNFNPLEEHDYVACLAAADERSRID